ncbi:type IV pilus secretin PilQ [Thermodesulfobacteriota bacterium]
MKRMIRNPFSTVKWISLLGVAAIIAIPSCAQTTSETRATSGLEQEEVARIVSISTDQANGREEILIEGTAPLTFSSFLRSEPSPSIIVDIFDVDASDLKVPIVVDSGFVGIIDVLAVEGEGGFDAKFLISLKSQVDYDVISEGTDLKILLIREGEGEKVDLDSQAPIVVETEAVDEVAEEAAAPEPAPGASVIGFEMLPDMDLPILVVKTSREVAVQHFETSDGGLVVSLPDTQVPQTLRGGRELGYQDGTVGTLYAYQSFDAGLSTVRLVIKPAGFFSYKVFKDGNHTKVVFLEELKKPATAGGARAPKEKPPQWVNAPAAEADGSFGPEGENVEILAELGGSSSKKVYTGERISLDFKDADIKNILRLIAEVSQLNIVAGDDVQGKVTLRLRDVPWDQALDIILKTNNFGTVLDGNILRIAPLDQLSKETEDAIKAKKTKEKVEDLVLEIIPVNYASVDKLITKITPMKSDREEAQIFVDERTSLIIVKDLKKNVEEMKYIVDRLDTQTPQVMIEARIVEISTDFEREIGIQWGGRYLASPATGNPTGHNFPASVGVSGGNAGDMNSPIPGFAVDLPAAVSQGSGGALGLVLGSLTNTLSLDMRLSALEKNGHAKIISNPRVATLDNHEAKIEQGEEVPYEVTGSITGGSNTQFKEAKLSLSVLPHITEDRSIIMDVKVTNDTPIPDATVGVGYRIGTKSAETKILVKDGETAVIGGIYTKTAASDSGGIPWFQEIPILKYLFKKQGDTDKRKELILFITPKIMPVRGKHTLTETM